MLKVVIIGYGGMFMNLIAGTLDAGCEIAGVFRAESRRYHPFIRRIKDIINPSIEYNYIKSYNLPEINAQGGVNTKEFRKALLRLNPDIILVGSWGEKIKKEIYDIPKIAAINAHPSLLPQYRGPNPYFWTIRNQEQVTGVTFHLIDKGYDTGAILAQEEIKIYPSDTGKTLKDRTVLIARGVVCELLKALQEDMIIPLSQREDKASYYSYPECLELDFTAPAKEIDAVIRAINPWGRAYFYHKEVCFAVIHSDIEENLTEYKKAGTITGTDYKTRTICVLCGNDKILRMKIEHYNRWDKPFTGFYIKRELTAGCTL